VASFLNPNAAAGRYDVPWTRVDDAGRRVGPGVYFYRLQTASTTQTRKLMVAP